MQREIQTSSAKPGSSRTIRAAPVAKGGLFLLLTASQWRIAVIVGLVLALAPIYLYYDISAGIGVALFVLGVIIVHLRYASRYVIPVPHLVLAIAILQYVLGAWLSYYHPSPFPLYNIGPFLPQYLGYATGALIASAVGWGLGIAKLHPPRRIHLQPEFGLLLSLDLLIVLGFAGMILSNLVKEGSIAFVFILLASLRYLGVYGRMLCKGTGWVWRLAIIILFELLLASSYVMFHGLILWMLWSGAFWIFVYRPSWRVILTVIAGGFLMLLPMNQAKWQLRRNLFGSDTSAPVKSTMSTVDRSLLFLSYLSQSMVKTVTGDLDEEFVADTAMRYNQGWIIARVMQHVPMEEPYAAGETLKDAFISALVPRLFLPGKVMSGGKVNMEKYAGVPLNESTSMNLGYAGEMYANFGYWGGMLGCGVYAFLFGLLFRTVCRRAFAAPLWWAVVPYVGFAALKAEDDVVGVVNWISKACLIVAVIVIVFPDFRAALFPRRGGSRTATRNRKPRRSGEAAGTTPHPAITASAADEDPAALEQAN